MNLEGRSFDGVNCMAIVSLLCDNRNECLEIVMTILITY